MLSFFGTWTIIKGLMQGVGVQLSKESLNMLVQMIEYAWASWLAQC